jgi:hypothetical protein
VAWVYEWTIPTERPPLVGDVSANLNYNSEFVELLFKGKDWLHARYLRRAENILSLRQECTRVQHASYETGTESISCIQSGRSVNSTTNKLAE